MAKSRKSTWTEAYDEALTQVMQDLGIETCQQLPSTHSWSKIQWALAQILEQQQQQQQQKEDPTFSAKQCRDRWLNHLAPGIVKGNWSVEEKDIIIEMASAQKAFSFKEMAKQLPGRPCADVKNMYHSLVRSGKIDKSDKPRALDRTRLRGLLLEQVGQQQQQQQPDDEQQSIQLLSSTEVMSKKHERPNATSNNNTTTSTPPSDNTDHERPKKMYRKSGIPLVAAPPFASPNTTNAARVLMSLDVTYNSTWPDATLDVTTESSMDKHPYSHCHWEHADDGCTVVSALPPCTIEEPAASQPVDSATENVFCKIQWVRRDNTSCCSAPQLLSFATLPSTHLTFAQARTVLQTELAHKLMMMLPNKQQESTEKQQPQQKWCFIVPGQGRLTPDQETKLRVDFLVTPDALGTVSAPLPVTIELVGVGVAVGSERNADAINNNETVSAVV